MGRVVARHVWLGPGHWLSPGALAWDRDGVLRSVARPQRGERARDWVLFPGLVDAHVHLQLEPLRGRRPRGFVDWVRAVIAARRELPPAALRASAVRALRALLGSGTTAVGEIDSTGQSPRALADVSLAGRCYQELLGFHLDGAAARRWCRTRSLAGTRACPGGLSPHAPYSVSRALFAAAVRSGAPLSIHAAEIPEEQQFLHTGKGPFRDLLAELGRLPAGFRAPGVGTVRWLDELGALRASTLLVHCQELERGDLARIAARGAHIAVCPGTIEYFGRTAPPVGRWLAAGVTVALGTDSLASNSALSMRAELRRAARLWPHVAPATLLAMATQNGGSALVRPGLGRLRRGSRADFVAVAAGGRHTDELCAAFVHGEATLVATWLRGRPHAAARSRRA